MYSLYIYFKLSYRSEVSHKMDMPIPTRDHKFTPRKNNSPRYSRNLYFSKSQEESLLHAERYSLHF